MSLTNHASFTGYLSPVIQLFRPQYRAGLFRTKVTGVSLIGQQMLHLKLQFKSRQWRQFKPGQFIHVHIEREGRYLSRCFSIASSPAHFSATREIWLGIRINEEGQVSSWLSKHLKTGDTLYISAAQGDFVLAENERHRLFVAGGSGITPILSMLQSLDDAQLHNSTLLFSLRDTASLPFRKTIDTLKARGLRCILHDSGTEGRITQAHISALIASSDSALYVCGPEGLIQTCEQSWRAANAPAQNFHCERFGGMRAVGALSGDTLPDSASIHFTRSGSQAAWQKAEGLALLDFAEKQGLKPSFGCRIGICHQCTCRKESGRTFNLKTRTLSDAGPEDIQLCQSVPVEDLVLTL